MWKTWSITKNKSLEIVLDKPNRFVYFDICSSWTKNTDHAGFNFYLSLLGFIQFEFNITDNRHWNNEENRWFNEGEYSLENGETIKI